MSPPEIVVLAAASEEGLRHRILLRVLSVAALGVVCLVFPAVGPNRFAPALMLFALTPVPVLLPRWTRQEHWMIAQSAFDVSATIALIGLVPDVWAAGLVIVVSSPTAGAPLLGRRAFVVLEGLGLAGLALVAGVSGVEGWIIPLLVAAVMTPVVASYIEVFFTQEMSAAARLNDVARSSSAMFWESDARTDEFIAVSGGVEELLGFAPEELPSHLSSLIDEADRGEWFDRSRATRADRFVLECRCRRSDGELRWLRLTVRRLTVRGREVFRGIAVDITELITVYEEVRRRAETDELTGLANRSTFVASIDEMLAARRPFAVLVLDIDRFEDVNDTLGHGAGDEYLVRTADRLAATIGDGDGAARMGGDEFGVAVFSTGDVDEVMEFARNIARICEAPLTLEGLDFAGAVSIGVAISPVHGVTSQDLIRRADLAMYAAKKTGSAVHLFEYRADERKVSRLRLSNEAGPALANGEMKLWFQPKVDLETGELTGAEGLLRWEHPERGILTPAEFLDFVELSRHSAVLCRSVIDQGASFVAMARRRGIAIRVSVNVTLRDILEETFGDTLTGSLRRHRVDPAQLILEVTEREIMDDRTGFERAAQVVRHAGVQLSIDDFGTGHSSLLRLHQLPVNELKIDRSFVSGVEEGSEASIIVASIIELGRALDLRVVAEGVEQKSEADLLRDLGCHLAQGYHYSAALPPMDFLDALGTRRGAAGRPAWPVETATPQPQATVHPPIAWPTP